MQATSSYINMYCFPHSGKGLEWNFKALLMCIIYPRPLTVEESFYTVISGRQPPERPEVTLTIPEEILQRCIRLQQQGTSLRQLSRTYGYSVSRLCRMIARYRREVLGEDIVATGGKQRTEADKQAIFKIMAKGFIEGRSAKEIAKIAVVNIATISNYKRNQEFKKLMESMNVKAGVSA
jgi:transposase